MKDAIHKCFDKKHVSALSVLYYCDMNIIVIQNKSKLFRTVTAGFTRTTNT